jgi:hypothetical protein
MTWLGFVLCWEAAVAAPPVVDVDSVPVVIPPAGGLPGPEGVVNGTDAVPGEYAEVVVLVVLAPPYVFPYCSGTVIDARWVLTAGHCLAGFEGYVDSGDVGVVLDASVAVPDDPPNLSVVVAEEAFVHPDYDPSDFLASHDVGLLELRTPISSVDPAVLNDEAPDNGWNGEELTFVGYGATDDSQIGSGRRRFADMPLIGFDPLLLYAFDDSMPHQNLCSGDSGGAAFEITLAGRELAGVNSFVFAYDTEDALCAEGGTAAARVDIHVDWIRGFAPDVLVEPPGGDPDTDVPPPEETADTGEPPAAEVDPPEWGEPHEPSEDQYPLVCGCHARGGATGDGRRTSGAAVSALGVLVWLTRRPRRPYSRASS